ncbi:MAG TPA: carboxymuconolactone decarboxylase family protein [Steroidobacteraceae bacterium]|nr:carboxymuconolactone decarboxylase family protein [Steroidobacteraceae bacterium]
MPNTLLSRVPRQQLDPRWQQAWDTLHGLTGSATFVEVFAQAPEILDFVLDKFYARLFFGGAVAQRYKQLARLKLSFLHGCRTCNRQNVPGAREAGFTVEQINALSAGEDAPFTAAERAVIAYAAEVSLTNLHGRLSPDLYARLRTHFSDGEILELGAVMAVICGMAKLSFVLDLVEREDYCPFTAPPEPATV